jgi:lipopolysaccharide transport system permease protein
VIEALFNLVVRVFLLVPVFVWVHASPGWQVALVPLGVIGLVLLGLALGVLIAPLGLLYDDAGRALLIATWLWFFLTPVIYRPPASGLLHAIVKLNPVTPAFSATRAWLTGGAAGFPLAASLVTAVAAVVLAWGWLLYRIAQPHLVVRL